MSDVRGVMVTHIHPDHYGLAGRIREASGAWISLHPADAKLIESRYIEPEELLKMVSSSLTRAGAPEGELAGIEAASMPVRGFVTPTYPDKLLEDGDRPDVPGWNLRAIHTPGHSPGHLCFYLAEQRLMLTGDHVLPRITPNISYHPQSGPNPLGDFLDSLDKVAREDVELVLPAHEHRFVGLDRPGRRPEGPSPPAVLGGRRCHSRRRRHRLRGRRPHELVTFLGPDRWLHAAGGRR